MHVAMKLAGAVDEPAVDWAVGTGRLSRCVAGRVRLGSRPPGCGRCATGRRRRGGLGGAALGGDLQCRDRKVRCGKSAEGNEPCRAGHRRKHEAVEAAEDGAGDQLTERWKRPNDEGSEDSGWG